MLITKSAGFEAPQIQMMEQNNQTIKELQDSLTYMYVAGQVAIMRKMTG